MNKFIIIFLLLILKSFQKSDVYFTKEISGEKIVEMFKKLNITLKGNIGLKVHTGEIGGPYFLRPDFLQEIYDYTNGTFIECNTAYPGYDRHYTEGHKKVLEVNGWVNNRAILLLKSIPSISTLNISNIFSWSASVILFQSSFISIIFTLSLING